MQGIEEILKAAGVEGDAAKKVIDGVKENYRTISEVELKGSKLKEYEAKMAELADQLKSGEGTAKELEGVKAKLAEYEAAKSKADEEAATATARKDFETKFDAALGDKKFANKLTRQAVVDKAFDIAQANPDMDAATIIDGLTKGEDGIFANAQREPVTMPSGTGKADADNGMRDVVAKLFG